jgi:hypothetical protein
MSEHIIHLYGVFNNTINDIPTRGDNAGCSYMILKTSIVLGVNKFIIGIIYILIFIYEINEQLFFIFIFQLYILNCVLSASQKSCDDCLFLNKCSTEKLCLLADVMLVSMIMLRIMVSKKKLFSTLK